MNPSATTSPFARSAPHSDGPQYVDKVVFINRCAKVVKGGRRFSFSALVVSGDQKGRVGVGYGKANEVPEAIRKGTERAQNSMVEVQLRGDTIPHMVVGQADGGKVILRPASQGTGIIAGGGVRAVLEAVGIKNVLSKSLGSNNHLAIVNATIDGLLQLRSRDQVKNLRFTRADGAALPAFPAAVDAAGPLAEAAAEFAAEGTAETATAVALAPEETPSAEAPDAEANPASL